MLHTIHDVYYTSTYYFKILFIILKKNNNINKNNNLNKTIKNNSPVTIPNELKAQLNNLVN